jgi:hypothetical protein
VVVGREAVVGVGFSATVGVGLSREKLGESGGISAVGIFLRPWGIMRIYAIRI